MSTLKCLFILLVFLPLTAHAQRTPDLSTNTQSKLLCNVRRATGFSSTLPELSERTHKRAVSSFLQG